MQAEPHNECRELSPSASIVQIEASRFLPWIVLSAVLSGLALGVSVVTLVKTQTDYHELERENRLAQLQLDNMKVAMLAARIDPAPHLKGEAP